MATITTDQVWEEIEKNIFAVLGMVTAQQEARTVGIVYATHKRMLYISSVKEAWKVKHVAANPHVSMTVTIPKNIPLMPWIKIPAATITFQGTAQVLGIDEVSDEVLNVTFRGMEMSEELRAKTAVIAVQPKGQFVTYGVGVSLQQMRDTQLARGRVAV